MGFCACPSGSLTVFLVCVCKNFGCFLGRVGGCSFGVG